MSSEQTFRFFDPYQVVPRSLPRIRRDITLIVTVPLLELPQPKPPNRVLAMPFFFIPRLPLDRFPFDSLRRQSLVLAVCSYAMTMALSKPCIAAGILFRLRTVSSLLPRLILTARLTAVERAKRCAAALSALPRPSYTVSEMSVAMASATSAGCQSVTACSKSAAQPMPSAC